MNISEKVAYLKGLAEGMGMNDETREGKLFRVVIDVLEDIALQLEDIEETALDIREELDQVSDGLSELEDEVYDDGKCDCGCEDEEDGEEEEPVFYSVKCDACDNVITVDENVLDLGSIECPACGEIIELNADTVDSLDEED
jgi:ribosomal protein S27E